MSRQKAKVEHAKTIQYLVFALGDERYAIEIDRVQEIRAFTPITPIPTAPPYVRGVMNLRGTVAPVVGLREKFALTSVPYDKFSVIVVLLVEGKAIGLVVDAVTDVLNVPEGSVEPLPELGGRVDTSFIVGIIREEEKYALVLDSKAIVGEAPALEEVAA